MSEASPEQSPRELRLKALIAQLEAAAAQGQPWNEEEMLAQHAEFAAELREYFAKAARLRLASQNVAEIDCWLKQFLASDQCYGEEPPTRPDQFLMSKKFREGLKLLSSEEGVAFVLRYLQGWSLAQIAEHCGLSPTKV